MGKNISVDSKAKALGIDLRTASQRAIKQLQSALKQTATATYNELVRRAQDKLKTTRDDYINALHWEQIGPDSYIIYLDDTMGHVEDGFPTFDMKPGLLKGPNAKTTKKGTRYNTVPQTYKPKSKQAIMAPGLREQLQEVISANKLQKVFKDKTTGRPLEGIVATVKETGIDRLKGLVKVQKRYKERTQSFYMTFRRVSDNSDPGKWIHPGYSGAHLFPEVENYLERQIEQILKAIFE